MPGRERTAREQLQKRSAEAGAAAGNGGEAAAAQALKRAKASSAAPTLPVFSALDALGACPHLAALPAASATTLWKALTSHHASAPLSSRACLECGKSDCSTHAISIDARLECEVYCSKCSKYCFSTALDSVRLHAHYDRLRNGLAPLKLVVPPGAGLRGIMNLGNTCFMNSVLQALLHLRPVRDSFLSGEHRLTCDIARESSAKPFGKRDGNAQFYARLWQRSWSFLDSLTPPPVTSDSEGPTPTGIRAGEDKTPACFGCEFEHLFAEMWCAEDHGAPMSPDHLLQTLWGSSEELAGYLQQDAQEFYSFVVNQLHAHTCQVSTIKAEADVMSPSHAGRNGALACSCVAHANLGGVLKSSLQCSTCRAESSSFEPFFDLSLPLDRSASLQQCLDAFIKSESLQGQEQVMCDKCQSRQDATKTMSIHQLPNVFTVHMKRFETGSNAADMRKMDAMVEFPLCDLDLGRYASSPCREHVKNCSCSMYDLHALVQHSGQLGNMESGHYVSFVRQAGQWFRFDDAFVSRVSEHDVRSKQAYLLMYTRRQRE